MKPNKKKWGWNEKPPEEEPPKKKHGRCEKCDSGRFQLSVSKGRMIRTCRGCNDSLEV